MLLSLFGLVVLVDAFPIQLLQPLWILTVASTLANFFSIPLLGILLIHMAAVLSPPEQPKLQVTVARLSALLALLFLLIQPLLAFGLARSFAELAAANKQQLIEVNKKARQITQSIQQAGSFDELRMRMTQLQGPQIPDQARFLPLPNLKQKLIELVKTVDESLPSRQNKPNSPVFFETYKKFGRASALSLLASIGFGILAWSPAINSNILLAYLKSIGLFGITPASLLRGAVNYFKTYSSRRQEAAELKNKRRAALLMQQRHGKIEEQQMREQKRQQMEEQKRSIQIRKERERMQEAERKMERKRQLELEKQRNQQRKGK